MKITARYEFEAAHRLRDPALSPEENERLYGPCSRVHGHTYLLEITLQGEVVSHGMLFDFNDIEALVKEHVIALLDHQFINDIPAFQNMPTTAESIACWVWHRLEPLLADAPAVLETVTVSEGPRFSASATRGDHEQWLEGQNAGKTKRTA